MSDLASPRGPAGPRSVPPGGEAIDFVQLLTPDGARKRPAEYPLDVDADTLRGFYRDLVLLRRFDTEATALQRHGELGLWAPLLGQEAAQIGAGRALAPQDFAFPTFREHGLTWCRGVDPAQVLALFRGASLGGWDPAVHNLHLYSIVIGTQVLHAAGYAMGIQRDGHVGTGDPARDTAVLACFGDGATSQGDVNEAFVFASVFNLPVVFFCQNNQFAISEPNQRQSRIPLYRRASGFGFPGVRVDGNDVLAVYAVTRDALDRARRGEGPTFIEAYTYRMGAHTTSDDPSRYRPTGELEHWQQLDPIDRLVEYLLLTQTGDERYFAEIAAEADALGVRVREACRSIPNPLPESMFDHVHVEPHAQVDADRAWFRAYQSSFETAGGAA
ncbi:MAG: pyruvate dehydrogenase (acetyl-transferring) E1 component subunit alpha [Kineosporiaceae bacterium]|nr:pyruvate dehydrogenase (acetyl-transferring) E1 component subunit alpha [Kineosporiaceae bacterium]